MVLVVENLPANAEDIGDVGLIPRKIPGIGKIPWRREWQPSPVFLLGKSHGQEILTGCCPRGHEEPDTTEVT